MCPDTELPVKKLEINQWYHPTCLYLFNLATINKGIIQIKSQPQLLQEINDENQCNIC